ncbi:MAG: exported protein of unknown function [Candidatus Saccharibacteria bacterium]|nr:exported protein of unknown function [Candidatus Saccharibacteria bacterium]
MVGAAAAQYTSPNYKVNETFFGSGGNLDNQSTNYKAKTAAGELAVGNISSPHFQANAGFNTTDTILLEVNVNGGVFDLGTLSESQVKVQSTTFTVKDYLSTGYTVQMVGRPPSNSGHELTAMSAAASSSPGTEQFGINLAANNLSGVGPFGAVPSQVPDATFGFGYAVSPYDTSNLFKFVEGDTIARSDKSTGTTSYTLSFIENMSRVTPGGSYGTSLFTRVIPTF